MTTYLDMIKEVILTCKSPKGMSLQAIKKAVEALKTDGKGIQGKHVTKVLHQAVEDGVLTKVGAQHYKVSPEQRKELKKELSPRKSKSPSPKKAASKPKKSTAPKATKAKKTKAKKGPAGAAKKSKAKKQ